jgi:hypothetical protein
VLPRECDNDDCDYYTYVDGEGRGRARWEHVEGCEGPVNFESEIPATAPEGSFLAYMQGRGKG